MRMLLEYYDAYVTKLYSLFYYPLMFKLKGIRFKKMPIIRGTFKIYNYGECRFGSNLIFNSSFRANPVGLNKPCSIFIEKSGSLFIDDYSGFSGVSIYCINEIKIGKYLNCGGNVSIWDTDFHPLDYLKRRANDNKSIKTAPITIGDDVFIGANTIVLKGVTIGDRVVIGAGSVISKSIPANQVWAGNPIAFIKNVN